MQQQQTLLELPGEELGEHGRLRVLESRACDQERLYERILSGRYGKPFIVEDGRTRRLYFSLRFVQSSMRIADPFALDFAYTRNPRRSRSASQASEATAKRVLVPRVE